MLNVLLKTYLRYKLKKIYDAEIKSMLDDNYTSPYFDNNFWNKYAWQAHRDVRYAYDAIVQKIKNFIKELNLTDEQYEKISQNFVIKPYLDENKQLNVHIKVLNN